MLTLPVIKIEEESFWQDIYTPLEVALSESSMAITGGGQIYALGHHEVESVLKDPRFQAADLLGMMGLDSGPVWEWWKRLMFSNNDPFHGRIRKLVQRAFTPRQIDRHREAIRATSRALVSEAIAQGEIDVMNSVAHDLPSIVMAKVLRIPDEDRENFAQWTTDIGLAFGAAESPEIREQVEASLANLDSYVEDLIERRRGDLGEDLLSDLIQAGDQLSTRELIDLIENLLFAGHDTTRGSIAVLFSLMAKHSEISQSIRSDKSSARQIVDEILRFEAITFSTCRTNSETVVVGGLEIPEGTPLGICLPSASRDPKRYTNPQTFDVHRPDSNPPTFGAGAHYCIGATLARAELQELLIASVDLTSNIEVLEEPSWVPFAHIRRYESLNMSFQGTRG